ncbi:asparagine synthase (glutamine-hydrolyzing) [Parasediminibacterium sp. JCM 36343]|uniref:asparagine synthase (glutamine-hydrolyzing) n=1 Tax=Parasediminibacterium sp. JCM 36343 TaxID=3374279 RepID=UPI0039799832
MCRIAGIFDPSLPNLERDILKMRDAMYRGGPDGAGIYIEPELGLALGHRRLALLDLSVAGHQPMKSADESIQIVFNGEVYNFQTIKADLEKNGYQFFTQTDTEVIINAYLFWGTACFELFNGMFALAIWDKKKQQLILARDYAGIKPLYYYISKKKLIFASEIRAFKAISPTWAESEDWKIPFLAYGHLPEPFTTLQDVQPLPKGSYAIIELPSLQIFIHPFYNYVYSEVVNDEVNAVSLVKKKVEEAVERHLISDAPLGVFLSGGIDSSILTIIASSLTKHKIKTLSIVFEEQAFSEELYQKMIVEQTGVEHHSFVVTNQMLREEFSQIMEAMDQPSIDGINSYFICKFARAYGLTAVLSGLGADELLGGYDSIRKSKLLKSLSLLPSFVLALTNYSPNEKIKRIAYLEDENLCNKYLFYRGVYSSRQIADILDLPVKKVLDVLNKVAVPSCNSNNEAQQACHVEQHLYMQNQLLKDTDYMSMWHGIEVRVPFLDKEVINACNTIGAPLKYNFKKKPKYLLIEAFKDVLPAAIWNRKKQGFTFPFAKWMNMIVPSIRGQKFEIKYEKLTQSLIHWSKYWTYVLAVSSPKDIIFLKKGFERVCFFNLDAFASMGGIEKFNRALLYGLSALEWESYFMADAASMYDSYGDDAYFANPNYRCYHKKKGLFVWKELLNSYKYKQVVLGHVNFAIFGLLIKLFHPTTKIFVVAHGIEVWGKITGLKKLLLERCNIILAVSHFTRDQLIKINNINENKIVVFHNTLDPYFVFPKHFAKPQYLLERYNIRQSDKIILTLTRLAYTEKYKGYDKVIDALPGIIKEQPNIKYLIAGKPDKMERERLLTLIKYHGLEKHVFLVGFVAEEEITDHYQLADVFIMPSKKEGFGIVFIEAMACGLPVIAGNQDGSVDALQNGKLGMLVDPENQQEIVATLTKVLQGNSYTAGQKKQLQDKVEGYFGYPQFYGNLKKQIVN